MKYAVFILLLLLLTDSSWGYLDPGVGSLVVQYIFGIIFSVGLALRIFWKKIREKLK